MSIEAFSFVSSLVSSFPQSGDTKSQGDDHIRGLKQTLLATFPDADRAFRIPRTRTITSPTVLTIADENRIIHGQTGAGQVDLTLPSLGTASWIVTVVKASADGAPVKVAPASGLINGVFNGGIFIYTLFDPHTFYWNGSSWFHLYNGVPAGVVVTFFSGGITPIGWAVCDGSTVSPSTAFPELVLARGTTVIPNLANSIIRKC